MKEDQYIAIMGFGFEPPAANLKLVEQAVQALLKKDIGIAVGNLTGTFAVALQVVDQHGGQSMAVIDQAMESLPRPASTEVKIVAKENKHSSIAEIASAGLIIGGGPGTVKLAACFVKQGKTVVAISGTGGVVDDGSLPASVLIVEGISEAIKRLS